MRVIYYAPLVGLLLWAAVVDVRKRRIPNWVSFGLLTAGLMLSFLPWGQLSTGRAMAGVGVGFGVTLLLHLLGGLGAGDVKLLAAVGAWIGPVPVLLVFAAAAIVGMLLAVAQSARCGRLRALLSDGLALGVNVAGAPAGAIARPAMSRSVALPAGRTLPFAVAITAGTVAVLALPVMNAV